MTDTSQARSIDDTGEKIGGARKDWRARAMVAADLDDMTDAEAVEIVKKDNVWPQPDWEVVVAAGMPAVVAAHVKIMRDKLAKTPRLSVKADAGEVRKAYIEMISMLREQLMAARSVEDVNGIYSAVIAKLGDREVRSDPVTRNKFFSVYQGRNCPFAVAYGDASKARTMVAEGFPSKVPAWRKGVKIYPVDGGGVMAAKKGWRVGRTFESEATAWKILAEEHGKSSKAVAPAGPAEPERPHLDRLDRKGLPDLRGGADVSAEDFIATFGFRGVEFGLWLPDDERQAVLNFAYDALHDLADVLDWNPANLSLEGTLAVAFGARGKGGRAAAHYESGRKVVNLTRLTGAGFLAHEYAHAIDNWAGEVDRTEALRNVPGGTGYRFRLKDLRGALRNLSDDQSEAWVRLVDAMFNTELTREEATVMARSRLKQIDDSCQKYSELLSREMGKPKGRENKKYIKEVNDYLASQAISREIVTERQAALERGDEVQLGRRRSSYSEQAQRLCGKSGEYWLRPTEMFARAFESHVFDKLTEKGASSPYLVHAVEEDRYSDPDRFKGNPYPVGAERAAIRRRIEAVTASMKPRVELAPKALSLAL